MDEARLEALREIGEAWHHRRCVLIGASALDVRLGLSWRTTEDRFGLAADASPSASTCLFDPLLLPADFEPEFYARFPPIAMFSANFGGGSFPNAVAPRVSRIPRQPQVFFEMSPHPEADA